MKLIIDIPFEAYYTFKNDLGKGNLNALAEIIANGKPYEERPQIMSCFNCKYDSISGVDEPCRYCEKHSEWQAKGGEAND